MDQFAFFCMLTSSKTLLLGFKKKSRRVTSYKPVQLLRVEGGKEERD